MQVMARTSRKKSWQTGRQRVSVNAALAIQRENVMNRLVRLRTEVGHPEKPDEPLPQDQAAARAGVTARQWQRWEAGASVPYARNLSAVADAFNFDVGEFYDGPAGQQPAPTPTPFAGQDELHVRLDRIEARQKDVLTRLDRLQTSIEAAISESAAAETEEWQRIAQELVRGGSEAPSGSPPGPQPTSGAQKKRAAAQRTQ